MSRRDLLKALKSLSLMTALCVLATPAAAAPAARNRFHRLTNRLAARLNTKAGRTISAVAELRSATAFVVAHDPNPTARALVLTNHHVAGNGVTPGERLKFLDGSEGRTERLIASDAQLDYALVEVSLPWGAKAFALPLLSDPVRPNRAVYSAAAHANLEFSDMNAAVGGGPAAHAAIAKGPGNQFALGLGNAHPTNTAPVIVKVPAGQVVAFLTNLPNAPGMSGSPVLARDSHRVIGLHSSGGGTPDPWEESAVPADAILKDLRAKHAAMDPHAQRLVNEIFLGAR